MAKRRRKSKNLGDCGPGCGCTACKGQHSGMLAGLLSGCGCPNPRVEQVQGIGQRYGRAGLPAQLPRWPYYVGAGLFAATIGAIILDGRKK